MPNRTGITCEIILYYKVLRLQSTMISKLCQTKTILLGVVKGAKRRGRQKNKWEDNIKEWTRMEFGDFLRAAEDRVGWKGIVVTPSVESRYPLRLRD